LFELVNYFEIIHCCEEELIIVYKHWSNNDLKVGIGTAFRVLKTVPKTESGSTKTVPKTESGSTKHCSFLG